MSDQDRDAATALRDRFTELGANNPEEWALSEISENIPQLARFLVLRNIWPEFINSWTNVLNNIPAGARLLTAGADRDDLTTLARAIAYETAFGLLAHLTASECNHTAPGWSLRETTPEGHLTGRTVQGLHEDLLSTDPSGRDGQDLFR
ncbi:hypothetical protein [Streptosporangium sp. NPDC002721]|uniref:hypothetical protein n=1 Tax=Streptosporangium sp. NPDC002721 TaxID=3366188 RepID=UPI0036A1972B